MASGVIERQIKAFSESVEEARRDAVVEAHHEAVAWQALQDMVLMGTSTTKGIVNTIENWRAKIPLDQNWNIDWRKVEDACRVMLLQMTSILEIAPVFAARNCPIDGLEEFKETLLRLREAVAVLQDLGQPAEARVAAAKIATVDYDALRAQATKTPPDPSWFEEDTGGLR